MLRFIGENADGQFVLPDAVGIEINCELGVPADGELFAGFARALAYLRRDGQLSKR